MKFTNVQAANMLLVAGNNTVYLPKADAQIRALTVFNPTTASVDVTASVNGKSYVKKTITAGATEVISQLFNQQLKKDEPFVMTGTGLNVLMTAVEITD